MTPAPSKVVSSRTDRSSNVCSGSSLPAGPGRDLAYISAPSAFKSRRSAPDRAASIKILSALSRPSSGSLSVHWQIVRAQDTDTSAASIAAATRG